MKKFFDTSKVNWKEVYTFILCTILLLIALLNNYWWLVIVTFGLMFILLTTKYGE